MAEERIGKYTIVEELGRGAMGVVYKAMDPVIGRTVAIKTIRFDILANAQQREEAQRRFLREAQSAGNLSHPNIVTIYDVGEDQGLTYIAMEFVEGKSLEDLLCGRKPWDPAAAVNLIIQVAEGLDCAHRKGIVHRDVKPGNILIDASGRPKIVDFGIARISSSNLTQTSAVMGTPFYMSPEQVAGKKVDQRADVFALGAIFYEILALEKPFGGDTLTTVIYKIMNETPRPLPQIVPGVPEALDAIVQKAMAKDAEARYQNCRELIEDLRAYGASAGLALEAAAPTMIVPEASRKPGKRPKTAGTMPPAVFDGPAVAGASPEHGRRTPLFVVGSMMAVIAIAVVVLLITGKGPSGRPSGGGGGVLDPAGGSTVSTFPPESKPEAKPETKPSEKESSVLNPPAEVKAGENKNARLIHEVKPIYPEAARSARVQGDVQVRLSIGPDGRVKAAEIILGPAPLAQASLEAVRQWVYEPKLVNGIPAESIVETTLSFALSAEDLGPGGKTEEPAKTEPAKPEPAKPEPAKTEPVKLEPTKTEPAPKAGETRPLRVLKRVDPVYPELARQFRREGEVTVEVRVGTTGRIERAVVVKGSPMLDEAALNAVRKWTFEPALANGVPVSTTATYSFQFSLAQQKPETVSTPPSQKPEVVSKPAGGTTTKPSAAPDKTGGAPAAGGDLAAASDALSRGKYRDAAAAARRALSANPGSPEAQKILTNAVIQLAPAEVKSLVDQYVLSLRVKQPVEFYRLHTTPVLFARVQKDMEAVMAVYDQIQASASNINLDLRETRYPTYQTRVGFSHFVTGVARQKGVRETLFNGRYTWRLELRGEDWIIAEITFEKAD
jgi:serine/threonine-protein kinase